MINDFVAYTYLTMCKICDENISDENKEKLRNCLFKRKNWMKLFLKKSSSIVGHLCLIKRHLDYPEGQVEVESLLTGSCF